MIGTSARVLQGVLTALAVLLLSACAGTSPQVSFYTLGTDTPVTGSKSAGTACSDKGIGIGPVSWPRYLDQPRIVTRSGPNKLEFDEFHRWGGSLQDDFQRTLNRYVSGLLQSSKVADFSATRRFKPDYRVELAIKQFDGQLGGQLVLDVGWMLMSQKSGKVIGLHDSIITKQASGQGYEALVHASSMAVADLSGEIAAELLKVCSAAGK